MQVGTIHPHRINKGEITRSLFTSLVGVWEASGAWASLCPGIFKIAIHYQRSLIY